MSSNYRIELLNKVGNEAARQISLLMRQHVPNLPELSTAYFKKAINNKSVKIFVALSKKNQIVGIVTMVFYRKVNGIYKAYVEDLLVNIENRRKGIGEALIKKVIQTARKMKINTVHLTSNSCRVGANLLYKKIGFKFYDTNYYKYNL